MTISPWFLRLAGSDNAPLRVFAFPFSGGSASSYASWRNWIPEEIELFGVQPPGRATRMAEPLIAEMNELVEQVVSSMAPLLDKPFVLFGHSNGALMAFAVANRLMQMGGAAPVAIVLSAKTCPTLEHRRERISTLPDPEFIERLKLLNGTPQELLDNPEIMRFFFPALRADFALGENFFMPDVAPGLKDIPALLLAGRDDEMDIADVRAWEDLFPRSQFCVLDGGHFFINSNPAFPQTLSPFLLSCLRPRMALA